MKTLPLFVLAILAMGSQPVVASTLAYEFSFRSSAAPEWDLVWLYETDTPTPPGTFNCIPNVTSVPPANFYGHCGSRDVGGAWVFILGVPTFSVTYTALTDTAFPNSPGVYLDLPALVRVGPAPPPVPAAVDIAIQLVPEPVSFLLLVSALVLFAGLTAIRPSHKMRR
jgi:hypothetical protein